MNQQPVNPLLSAANYRSKIRLRQALLVKNSSKCLVQSESIHRFLSLEQCIVFDRGWRNLLVMNPEAAARSPPSTKMRAGNRAVVVVVMAVAVGSGNPHLRVWEAVGLPASPTGRW